MAIKNYTTSIDPTKTIGEISQILARKGARKIVTDYDDDGNPVSLTFWLNLEGCETFYSMPCNWQGVLNAMEREKVERSKLTKTHALRVSWRIIRDWIDAQMAIIEASLVTIDQVFFPYRLLNNGKTIYQALTGENIKLLSK